MIILKIGGSLYDSPHLNNWLLKTVNEVRNNIIIVPGGGPFADQVRKASKQWKLPKECAHDMAVLGMQQYAHMMVGINNKLDLIDTSMSENRQSFGVNKVAVWAPYNEVNKANDIEKDWQTTSDSLALWLAIKVSAKHLCLVKSASVEDKPLQSLINSEVVDNNFEKLLDQFSGQLHFYHSSDSDKFIENLQRGIFS